MTSNLYLKSISIDRNDISKLNKYPYDIPSIKSIGKLDFDSQVTFFVGENGTGKSTLLESIAMALGFNSEGGSKNFNFHTKDSHSNLYSQLRIAKSHLRPRDGFFLRAESFYNVASNIDELDSIEMNDAFIIESFGGKSLHQQSHGESFLSLLNNRFLGNGIYILDEPEAALSPSRQLTALSCIDELVRCNSQFIIATHSPIILAYPNATIYSFTEEGIKKINYEETDHYQLTKYFLNNRDSMLKEIIQYS